MFVPVAIIEDKELWKGYSDRSERELMSGTMLWVTIPDAVDARHLTFSEWEYLRTLYKRAAKKALREHHADIAVYAMADPAEDGGIGCAHLGVNVMSSAEYEQFSKSSPKSMIYSLCATELVQERK